MSHLIRLESPLLLTIKSHSKQQQRQRKRKRKKENNQGKTTQIFGREKVKKIKFKEKHSM